jgi:ADP-heptose:LPS heptosyltransferase
MINLWNCIFARNVRPENPGSIFIGLIGGVGDLVLAAPSVVALKEKFPSATIRFGVGGGIFYDVIRSHPSVDSYETPFFYNVWKPRQRKKIERERLKDHDWVLLLDNPDRDWWKQGKHLMEIYEEKCGVSLTRRRPLISLDPEDSLAAEKFLQAQGVTDDDFLIVLSPEARSKKDMKEWPPDRFNALIKKIRAYRDVKIVNFASKDNPHTFNDTIDAGGFPLRPSADIIRRANLYIGLDNGLTHIAAGFDVKMVAIHIGYPVECCGPLSPYAEVVSGEPFAPPENISVEEVFEKVQRYI